MRLSEIRGENAIDILADILPAMAEILADSDVERIYKTGGRPVDLVSIALKNHKHQVLYILAKVNGEDPTAYNPSLIELPKMILDLINDPELKPFFTSQVQSTDETFSGSAMVNIEEIEAE